MNVGDYIDLLLASERQLADALADLAEQHVTEPDVGTSGSLLASWSDEHTRILAAHTGRPLPSPGADHASSRGGSHAAGTAGVGARSADAGGRSAAAENSPSAEQAARDWTQRRVAGHGDTSLLLDLQGAWHLAQEVHLHWWVLGQAARVLRDRTLATICATLGDETDRQIAWLRTRIEAIAPQVLIASP